jgi:sec-independent protein translocase protein TatA
MILAAFGPQEIFLILGVLVLFFGAKKLPELARGLGRSVGEFKTAKREFDEEIQKGEEIARTEETAKPAAKTEESIS